MRTTVLFDVNGNLAALPLCGNATIGYDRLVIALFMRHRVSGAPRIRMAS
jgi:hypothetical protein